MEKKVVITAIISFVAGLMVMFILVLVIARSYNPLIYSVIENFEAASDICYDYCNDPKPYYEGFEIIKFNVFSINETTRLYGCECKDINGLILINTTFYVEYI